MQVLWHTISSADGSHWHVCVIKDPAPRISLTPVHEVDCLNPCASSIISSIILGALLVRYFKRCKSIFYFHTVSVKINDLNHHYTPTRFVVILESHELESGFAYDRSVTTSTGRHFEFHRSLLYRRRTQSRRNSVCHPDNLFNCYQTSHEILHHQSPWMGRL